MTTVLVPPFANSDRGLRSSDHNRALKNTSFPWALPITPAGVDIVEGIEALGDGLPTPQDVDIAGHWDDSAAAASKFVDLTTEANEATAADYLLVPAVEEDELDYALIGQVNPFYGLKITNATPAAGGVFAYEYLNAEGVWTALPATSFFDGTTNMTNTTDDSYILFMPPEDWASQTWESDEVDTTPRYYIRMRVTTVFSTQPDIDQVKVLEMDATAYVTGVMIAPSRGLIDYANLFSGTAGGGNGTTILVVNHTKQRRGLITLVADEENERVALDPKVYVDRGDKVSLTVILEDGTTEPADIGIMLEIAA